MNTNITRLVVTHSDEITRTSARDLRKALRKAGAPEFAVEGVNAHMALGHALTIAEAYGVAITHSAYGDLTPAQRGALTRKRNTRLAKKAARKASPSTGYVKEQIRARKSA